MAIMASCDDAMSVVISVEAAQAANGSVTWTFAGSPDNPPGITVLANGDLRFNRFRRRMLVTMQLGEGGWVWRHDGQVNVFAYSENEDGAVEIVRPGHRQIGDVQVSSDGRSVTFCYQNRRRGQSGGIYERSRYLAWTTRAGVTYPIDPIISNGGNPQD